MTELRDTAAGAGEDQAARPGGGRARAVGVTFAANLALAGVNALTGVLAARLLGPSGRGELAAIQLWPNLLATLALLGLPDALVYFASTERSRVGRHLGTATALALAASVVAMAVGYPLLAAVLPNQSDDVVATARVYLLVCPVFVLAGLPFHVLRGVDRFGLWNLLRLSPSLVWLVVLGAGAVAGSPAPGSLARWYLLGLALLVAPIGVLTARRVPGPYRPDPEAVRPLLRYGLPGMVTTVPQLLNLRLDQLLMAATLPTRDLGLYVAAAAWSAAVSPLVTAVGTVLFPSVAAEPDAGARAAVLARGSRLAVVLTAVTVTAVGLATWPAVPLLFGDRFAGAVGPAVVLVVAAGVLGLGFVLQEGLRGLGRPRAVLRAEVVGLAVSVPLLAVLLPTLGIVGAALASVAGYSAVVVVLVRQATAETGLGCADLLVPTREDVRAFRQLVAGRLRRRP